MAKKQKTVFLTSFLQKDNLVALGTVFFSTSFVLLIGIVLSPSVPTILHNSASASTDFISAMSATGEPAPNSILPSDNFVNRAEFLKFLFDAQKISPSPEVYKNCFNDVKDSWYAPYVCYGEAKGLVQGYADKTFAPGKPVTVVEALKIILMNFQTNLAQSSPVTDMNFDPHAWYAPYVWTAYTHHLITWNSFMNSDQLPNLTQTTLTGMLLTRTELTEMLHKLIN